MRHEEGDTTDAAFAGHVLRFVRSGTDEARCTGCGGPTGIHPRWWFDGENELVPYCDSCSSPEGDPSGVCER